MRTFFQSAQAASRQVKQKRTCRSIRLLLFIGALFLSPPHHPATAQTWDFERETDWDDPVDVAEALYRFDTSWGKQGLFSRHLRTVRAEDFPRLIAMIKRIDPREENSVLCGIVLEQWAARDPAAAWVAFKPIFSCMTPDIFADSWTQTIYITPHPERLDDILFRCEVGYQVNFLKGLRRSESQPELKEAIFHEYRHLHGQYLPSKDLPELEQPPGPPEEHEDGAELGSVQELRAVLEMPLHALETLLHADPPVLAQVTQRVGIERLIREAPHTAPALWELIQRSPNPDTRSIAAAWSRADPDAAFAAFEKWKAETHDEHFNFYHLVDYRFIAWLKPAQRQRVLHSLNTGDLDGEADMAAGWALSEPEEALYFALKAWGFRAYSLAATELYFDGNRLSGSLWEVLDLIEEIEPNVADECNYDLLSELAEVDLQRAVEYGLRWLLALGKPAPAKLSGLDEEIYEYNVLRDRQRLLRVWRGEELEAWDGSMCDRTYGCLRKWAVTQPDAMRRWIAQCPYGPDVKAALTDLLENPNRPELATHKMW